MERHPREFEPFRRGDGRRFHIRTYNGGKWQVYGYGLEHICECETRGNAEMVADALERMADETVGEG